MFSIGSTVIFLLVYITVVSQIKQGGQSFICQASKARKLISQGQHVGKIKREHITCPMSYVTCHIACHMSNVTSHENMSNVMSHVMSHVT